jgi:3-hydroxy-9,10-secoandrosta-1,3,5(10)-triene-9,17-dione monooxygenase
MESVMGTEAVQIENDLLAKAKELQPTLLERVSKADELRRIPEETIRDFQDAGFFRMLQPKAYGGLEAYPNTFFKVQTMVGQACPSSAWVLGVVAVHSWQLALFDKRAQDDVWANDRSTLISSSYAPTGKVERVEGGYKISGRWSFSSGCDHCDWVFLGGFAPPLPGTERPPDMRTFLLPKSDYTIDDTWHVMGLKGTGSKDVVVDGAFVPEHRTHRLIDGYKTKSPGNEIHHADLYKLPFGQIFVRSVATTAIGIAKGALAVYRDIAAKRIAAGDGQKVANDPTAQMSAARAAMLIEEAETLPHRNFDEMMVMIGEGKDIPVEERIRYRYNTSMIVSKCMEAVDGLMSASGGRAIFLKSPFLRYFLDIHAARAHYANNPDKPARNWGGVQLQQKNTDFFL